MDVYDEELRARLWTKVRKRKSGCWEWVGVTSGNYGQISVRGVRILVHRLSWSWFNGAIPRGMCILHKCDNRSCVNPHHLFLGTHKDNTQDCIRKGRRGNVGGPCTRLRKEDGFVWCSRCETFLPKRAFGKAAHNKAHGCNAYCKRCSVDYDRGYQKRKRSEKL